MVEKSQKGEIFKDRRANRARFAAFLSLILAVGTSVTAQRQPIQAETDSIDRTRRVIDEVIGRSFPELNPKRIRVRSFRSGDTFFKTQFSISRFLTFRPMTVTILVNPLVFERGAPEEGVRAIIAHELGHALYFKARNRLELLGLARLASPKFTTHFERRTDLVAIERGYGPGLIVYRRWLYSNVSGDSLEGKTRDYFTPPEIEAILGAGITNDDLFNRLRKKTPRNLAELESEISRNRIFNVDCCERNDN